MTPLTSMRGASVAIFGLGGSGLATARALRAGGATPILWDDAPARVEEARGEGFTTEDLHNADWRGFSALVLAPGVPLTHPKPHWTVELAKAHGVEVIGDIELFCRERASIAPEATLIAVTGTNGKSTTTALIAHILREAGCDVQMGGNIGTPILALEPPADGRFHVVECSSFQIDLSPSLAPTIGVLLNITPDHLDRHGTMENYATIKERLVAAAQIPVVGVDDAFTRSVFERLQRRTTGEAPVAFGRAETLSAMLRSESFGGFGYTTIRVFEIYPGEDTRERRRSVASLADIPTLRGLHNAQNATAALAAVRTAAQSANRSIADSEISAALKTFPGLHHRMEEVGRQGRAIFINDSKATNADSTEKALLSFEGGIFWILGGKAKAGGIEPLRSLFSRIEKAYLIGEATEAFAATLAAGEVAHERCGKLDMALAAAARDAVGSKFHEPVVLLSPACASYDQFKNFVERGDRFRELVQRIVNARGGL
jgi:UDP-N-acetylmuramoylalanine--D-glutamate ligase